MSIDVTAVRCAAAVAFACVFSVQVAQARPAEDRASAASLQRAEASIDLDKQEAVTMAAKWEAAVYDGEVVRDAVGFDEKEVECLAEAMYFEARGEPERGQLAVGRVILNRVDSKYYPDTICGVVYQNEHLRNRCQFSFACDGTVQKIEEIDLWDEIHARATGLVECDDSCRENPEWSGSLWTSTHYHADYVTPFWSKKLRRTGVIGQHIFYFASAT